MPIQRLTSAQALLLLKRFRAGRLSKAQFCRKHSVSSSLFCYWLPRCTPQTATSKTQFQEVGLPHLSTPVGPCLLILPSGARLEFPASHLRETLAILTEKDVTC